MQYQGGEVVVGFFFDGADGQQPVIFGTLFRQSFIKDELTSQNITQRTNMFLNHGLHQK